MLQNKIKNLRKSRGMTQEELSIKLNVVRQTISKWEKGLSVPDADMLIKIADYFEVSTQELLGRVPENSTDINLISEQLSRINEELAIKNKRNDKLFKLIITLVIIFFIIPIIIIIAIIAVNFLAFSSFEDSLTSTVTVETTEIFSIIDMPISENGDFDFNIPQNTFANFFENKTLDENTPITLKISSDEEVSVRVCLYYKNSHEEDRYVVDNVINLSSAEKTIDMLVLHPAQYTLYIEILETDAHIKGNLSY